MSAKDAAARTLDLPDPVDLPPTDTAGALASLELAGGEPSETVGPDSAAKVGDPPAPEKRGPGRPPKTATTDRARGDASLTKKDLEKLRKSEVETIILDLQRRNRAQEERIEDLTRSTAVASIARDGLIEDALVEAVGGSIDTISNLAAVKFGPAARLTQTERAQLVPPWVRVAKIYLGQHAQHSPIAAAFLVTAGVVAGKIQDVEMANARTVTE